MARLSLLILAMVSLFLAACGTQPKVAPPDRAARPEILQPSQGNVQLELTLASGTYSCEQGLRVQVEREIRERVTYRIRIGWNGSSYQLDRNPSYSGLPRFEDAASGLVWIDLPWKGMLLDGKTNRPLANECRSV